VTPPATVEPAIDWPPSTAAEDEPGASRRAWNIPYTDATSPAKPMNILATLASLSALSKPATAKYTPSPTAAATATAPPAHASTRPLIPAIIGHTARSLSIKR
jgi:hypothetical protein